MKTHLPKPLLPGQRGITLIESMITLSVVAVITGMVVPSFGPAIERRHLEGVAAQLETDLQHARSLAVARNEGVRISFHSGDGASCYVVHTGAAGDCACSETGAAVCSGGAEALRSVRYGTDTPVSLVSNSRSILFDPVKGTVTPTATLRVTAQSGAAIHQVVNIMGRVRSCSPAPALPGYKAC
jgi:type IV fimbrial biogenesis protein FimT